MNRLILTLALFVTLAYHGTANASVLVDFSPNATGAAVTGVLRNNIEVEILAAKFNWNGGWITGGSIFSREFENSAGVGDDVLFLIWDQVGNGIDPIVNVQTAIDAIDFQDTANSNLLRVHTSFSGFYLASGTYYFAMPGLTDSGDNAQALGDMGSNELYASLSNDVDLDLEYFTAAAGTPFFQIEGYSAVPEPASIAIWSALGLGACGLVGFGRRKARAVVHA